MESILVTYLTAKGAKNAKEDVLMAIGLWLLAYGYWLLALSF